MEKGRRWTTGEGTERTRAIEIVGGNRPDRRQRLGLGLGQDRLRSTRQLTAPKILILAAQLPPPPEDQARGRFFGDEECYLSLDDREFIRARGGASQV